MGKGMNWHLSKEDIQMDKYMKMYWTSVIIKELQAKSTMRYYLIPVRVDSIKKGRNSNIEIKEEIKNPRVSRSKEITKIRAEINAKEPKETIAKNQQS